VRTFIALLVLMGLAVVGSGCAGEIQTNTGTPKALSLVPEGCRQVIFVYSRDNSEMNPMATFIYFDRRNKTWSTLGSFTCYIGKKGFAKANQKKEGDMKTPTGIYAIGPTFGYAAASQTKLPYRQVTETDFWIDDPQSPDYNKMVSGAKPRVSHELMLRADSKYKLGFIIEYNRNPIVPGKGSAIFGHLVEAPDYSTAGCVAFNEHSMNTLFEWLDPAKEPHIILNMPDSAEAPPTEAQ
jgi:L,D-peptidoglycan transpeptidase YkuD (ErfK/YbiS/YcfS/YnhG family)